MDYYQGSFKNDVTGVGVEGDTLKSLQKVAWGEGYMLIVTSPPKKLHISFYFSLAFGQHWQQLSFG